LLFCPPRVMVDLDAPWIPLLAISSDFADVLRY
jgi:hypothetical protein